MADWIPRQGEQAALERIVGESLYLGLHGMTAAQLTTLGDDVMWTDIVAAAGHPEVQLVPGSWAVPSGSDRGDPATYPVVRFTGQAGRGDVGGFYIRTPGNLLLAVGLHPDVMAGQPLKTMGEGEFYDVDLSLPAEPAT